jgi:hypothetical protein
MVRGNVRNGATSNAERIMSGAVSHFGRRSIGGGYTRKYKRVTNIQVSQARVHEPVPRNFESSYGLVELDTHADTACLGRNFCVIAHTDRVCEVSPYHPNYQPMPDVPIVQAATAYDNPDSGEMFMLIVNQVLYLGEALENTLLHPNQLRAFGVVVDGIPKHLAPDPERATHSI